MSNSKIPAQGNGNTERTPLLSTMAGDPDMSELVELFVQDLPRRVEELESVARAGDWESVRRVAHQLKGASGGYGFPSVGSCAGELEARTLKASTTRLEGDLEKVREQLNALVSLCQRVKAA